MNLVPPRLRAVGLVLPLVLLGIWQLLASAGVYSAAQLPPPSEVASALGELAGRGELWHHLAISTLGIGETPKIVLVAIGAFFPVYTTVSAALAHIDPHLVEVGRAYGRSGLSLLGTVLLPAATPAILSGLRLGLAQGWLFLVAAELIASSMGLGFLLNDSQQNGRVDRILLAIILLAVLGKLSDALLALGENRLLAARR